MATIRAAQLFGDAALVSSAANDRDAGQQPARTAAVTAQARPPGRCELTPSHFLRLLARPSRHELAEPPGGRGEQGGGRKFAERLKKYKEEHKGGDKGFQGIQEIQATFPYFVSQDNIENGNIDDELSRQVSVVEFRGATHDDSNDSTGHSDEALSTATPPPGISEAHPDYQSIENPPTDNTTQMEELLDSDVGLLDNDQDMELETAQQPDAKRKREEETPTKKQPEKVSRLDTNTNRRLFSSADTQNTELDLAMEVAKFEDLSKI